MAKNVSFTDEGFNDYLYWQKADTRTLKKINALIKDIVRNGNTGIGHPEPLKHDLSGLWSREIDKKNRLTYRIGDKETVMIYNCKGHYNDK